MSLSSVLKHVQSQWLLDGVQVIPVASIHDNPALDEEAGESADVARLVAQTEEACARMVAQAEEKCEAMIRDAESKVDDLHRAAEQAGYDEGLRRGRADAQVELATWKQQEEEKLTALAESMEDQRRDRLAALSPIVKELAMAAVQRLLYRELQVDPADIGAMVDELLSYVMEGTSVQIRVHPDEYVQARQSHPRWQLLKHGDWEVSIIPDASLSRGDCEIFSDAGHVDATIRTRLSEMQDALEGIMAHQGEAASGEQS